MDLAERISTLRRVNGLSARQLAALVDVAPTTVTRIESGAVSPSFDLAQEILTEQALDNVLISVFDSYRFRRRWGIRFKFMSCCDVEV